MSVNLISNPTPTETIKPVAAGAPTQPLVYNSPNSQARYLNGELAYQDKDGNYVNSGGQIVNANGDPLFISQTPYDYSKPPEQRNPYELPPGTEVYWGYHPGNDASWQGWRFYRSSDGIAVTMGLQDFEPKMGHKETTGTVIVTPVFMDPAHSPNGPKQEIYPNGQPKFVDSQGHSVNSSGFVVDPNGDVIWDAYHKPFMGDGVEYPKNLNPVTITPVYCSSPLDKTTYPNGTPTYKDGQGRPVNSSGQLVDDQGRPLYWDTPEIDPITGKVSPYTDPIPHQAFYGYDRPADRRFYYENDPSRQSHWGDAYTPMMGDGTATPVNPTLKIQTYDNGQQKYVDKNGKAVNSSGQLVDPATGALSGRNSTGGVAWGTGPFTPVLVPIMNPDKDLPLYNTDAPDKWLSPLHFAGSDVYSKSGIWLGALAHDDSYNNNNAIGFLLYTSNLAADGRFGGKDGNDFSKGLLSIQNSANPPKTLIAECVDVTMEQMVLNGGYTAAEAAGSINNLFPGQDPVSVAVRAETSAQLTRMSATNPPYQKPTQLAIEQEWRAFITDSTVQSTIKDAQSALMGATIDGCHGNLMLAIIAILVLLEALGIANLTINGDLSENLGGGSDDLNQILTEWKDAMDPKNTDGFKDPASAQAWMNEIKDLQAEMNQMPFDEQTMADINSQFDKIYDQQAMAPVYVGYHDSQGNPVTKDGQAVNEDGYPLFERENTNEDNGATVYLKNGTYYKEGSNPPAKASTNAADIKPLYWSNDPSAFGGLTDGTGNTMYGRPNPSSTIPGTIPTEDNTLLYVNKSQQNVFKVSAAGEAPSGVTVYNSSYYGDYYYGTDGYAVFCNPPPNTEPLTLDDQALNGSNYYYCDVSLVGNGGTPSNLTYKNRTQGSSSNLQASLNTFKPQGINFDHPGAGGETKQFQNINDALNALVAPLNAQSAAVGTKMQQVMANIERADNSLKQAMDTQNNTLRTISNNTRSKQ